MGPSIWPIWLGIVLWGCLPNTILVCVAAYRIQARQLARALEPVPVAPEIALLERIRFGLLIFIIVALGLVQALVPFVFFRPWELRTPIGEWLGLMPSWVTWIGPFFGAGSILVWGVGLVVTRLIEKRERERLPDPSQRAPDFRLKRGIAAVVMLTLTLLVGVIAILLARLLFGSCTEGEGATTQVASNILGTEQCGLTLAGGADNGCWRDTEPRRSS